MIIALVDELRRAPEPGLIGHCPVCKSRMIAKCGKIRMWHWAHHGERHCDPWWEETPWHVAWKSRFPFVWQEIVQTGPEGERHIADVKLPDGRVLEFQHSQISEAERRSREDFYRAMIWVVDGSRRKRDRDSFANTVRKVSHDPLVYSGFESECALLRDWVGRPVDVVFDFGERDEDIATFSRPVLWRLHPDNERRVILTPIYTDAFVAMLHEGGELQRISQIPSPRPPLIQPGSSRKRPRFEGLQQYEPCMDRTKRRL